MNMSVTEFVVPLPLLGATGAFGFAFGLLLIRSTPTSGLKSRVVSSGVSSVLMPFGVRADGLNGVSPEKFAANG